MTRAGFIALGAYALSACGAPEGPTVASGDADALVGERTIVTLHPDGTQDVVIESISRIEQSLERSARELLMRGPDIRAASGDVLDPPVL
jgi:hypothetical protein